MKKLKFMLVMLLMIIGSASVYSAPRRNTHKTVKREVVRDRRNERVIRETIEVRNGRRNDYRSHGRYSSSHRRHSSSHYRRTDPAATVGTLVVLGILALI